MKILVVLSDLDPLLARVYRNKFKKIVGWDVFITSSFSEAVKIIKKEKPRIVISDIILEGGDGFMLIREIRESEDPLVMSIPIIILTELSQPADKQLAQKLGATDYLVKSDVSLADVIKKAQRLINK